MIEIKNLTKTHINNRQSHVQALRGINLALPATGFVYLKGASGSGKSTLISILGGLDTFDDGEVLIDGVNLKSFSQGKLDDWRGKKTAFVFQHFNLLHQYTVAENIRIHSDFAGAPVTDEEIACGLKTVGLSGFENRMPKDLSGGEQQRVAIARAFVGDPKILFVDEPTAQLDADISTTILKLIKKLSKEMLVICVSHKESVMREYADRIVEIKDGVIASDEGPKPKAIPQPESGLVQTRRTRHIWKIGTRNLWAQKWRALSLTVLVALTMLFSSAFYMLSTYNHPDAYASSVKSSGEPYMMLSTNKDIKALRSQIVEHDPSFFYALHLGDVDGIIESSHVPGKETKNKYGQETIKGTFPSTRNGTQNMVAITDYMAKEVLGIDVDNFTIESGTIFFNAKLGNFQICGIIKTDYEASKDTAEWQYKESNIYRVIHVGIDSPMVSSIVELGGALLYVDGRSLALSATLYSDHSNIYNLSNNEVFISRDFNKAVGSTIDLGRLGKFTVKGVESNPGEGYMVYFSKAGFEKSFNQSVASLVVSVQDKTEAELASTIRSFNAIEGVTITSLYSAQINAFSENMRYLKIGMGIAAILLVALTIALFYYFATVLVADNRKTIGILRSMGATRWNIASIFFITIGFIALASWVITSGLSVITAIVINSAVSSSLALPFSVITFNPLLVLYLFGLCLGLGAVSTAIPISRQSFQTPIKQIKK